MEKSIEERNCMEQCFCIQKQHFLSMFGLEEVDVKQYSPLALAFIGDGIYDIIIRTIIVMRGNCQARKLHNRTSQIVKAPAQAAMVQVILPMLTEEEAAVYRRGRNAKSVTMAKNATMIDYRQATGFEALMGYLYLNDEMERLLELVKAGLDAEIQ